MKRAHKLKQTATAITLVMAVMMSKESAAQLNPFAASYFQNQYLANPAMVGGDNNIKVNAGYRKQWSGVNNSPYTIYATGEYSTDDKMNFGVTLYNDKAGMINTSIAMVSYAYYLPVNNNSGRIHLGISAGAVSRSLDSKNFNGEQGDVLLTNGNSIDLDGGIGVAYTDKKITLQASFPYMVNYFKSENSEIIDRPSYFAAASYKFSFENSEYNVEPKAAFRGFKGFDNIFDFGAQVNLKQFNCFGMYHTSKNATFGVGLKLIEKLAINAMYTTPGTVASSYIDGNFEIGLAFLLNKK